MLILGHVGLTTRAVDAVDRKADLRAPALLALMPDLVDKPLALFWPALVNGSTRSFAHSLLGAAAALAGLSALRLGWRRTLLLWGCYAGHLFLDRMWRPDSVAILFWPLLGPFPKPQRFHPFASHLLRYNLCGEALGLLALIDLYRRRAVVTRTQRA